MRSETGSQSTVKNHFMGFSKVNGIGGSARGAPLTPARDRGSGGERKNAMHRFENLLVWQRSVEFARMVSEACDHVGRSGGLAGQLRRSAVSIGSNVAEGSQRGTDKEFVHFLAIARGSAAEAETQIRIAYRSGSFDRERFMILLDSVQQIRWMLSALMSANS